MKNDSEKHKERKKDPKIDYMAVKCIVIGRNIREQRRLRRFTVEELAEIISLSESYIGLLERGERCPSLKIVFKLCDLFNITTCELLMPESDAQSCKLSEEGSSNGQDSMMKVKAAASLINTLTESELDFIIDTIKNIKKLRIRAV